MRDRLAFLHLPKSAGTSVRISLSSYFDEGEICPWVLDPILFGHHPAVTTVQRPVLLGDAGELAAYRCVVGHWALPTLLRGFEPADVMCLLREPRSRALSHYTFWRSWPQEKHDAWGDYDVSLRARQPLGRYLDDPAVAHQSDNLTARLLLGDDPRIPTDGFIAAGDVDALAADACARVDELGFVDVIERGDDVYRALDAWLGEELHRRRENVTDLEQGPPVDLDDLLDAATLARLHARSAVDAQIWSHVARRRGLSEVDAWSLADSAYGAALGRIVRVHSVAAARPEIVATSRAAATMELDELAAAQRPSAPVRLWRLVRRGPRAVAARVAAEVDHRRSRRSHDG